MISGDRVDIEGLLIRLKSFRITSTFKLTSEHIFK